MKSVQNLMNFKALLNICSLGDISILDAQQTT